MASEVVCQGCGHPMRMHVLNVLHETICLHSHQHTSTGVIMTYTVHCDCVNGVSEKCQQERARREEVTRCNQEEFAKTFGPIIEGG